MNQCPYCEIYLKSKGFLKRHIESIHKSEYPNNPDELQKIISEMNKIQRQLEGGLSPSFQKAFEAKKKSQRTKQDIDRYNAAINDINNASNSYNETITRLNKDRTDKLNSWNKAVDRFLNKYAT